MSRRLLGGRAIGLLLVLAGTVLLGLRWVEGPVSTAYAAVQSLAPGGGVLVVVGATLLLVLRSWRLLSVATLPALLVGAVTWPTVHRATVEPGPRDLVVLSSNLEYGDADPEDVVAVARERDADVVVLVEVTPEALDRLDGAGLARAYPHRAGRPAPVASGLVLLSRYPLDPLGLPGAGSRSAYARVHAPAGDVLVRAVHPSAPTSPGTWRDDLRSLAEWVATAGRGHPFVMLGDYNATWSHPAFRHLVEAGGLADSSRAAGLGWSPTWPSGRTLPPFAEIDHVLVRDMGVVDAGELGIGQTDHRAVWARLRVGEGR